jgi:hypothetical protein
MTRTEILRLTAGVVWLLAVALLGADRRIVRRLRRAGANSPETATQLALWFPLIRFRLAALLRSGAVVGSSLGGFYLDPAGFVRYRRNRRRRARVVLSVLLPVIVVLWWLSSQR